MAFIFSVEDGTGKESATSYASIEQADKIASCNRHEKTWWALSEFEKGQLLSKATRVIDSKACWNGCRTFENSALNWPRRHITDYRKNVIGPNEIPGDLIEATVEMARWLACRGRKTTKVPLHVWSALWALAENYHTSGEAV